MRNLDLFLRKKTTTFYKAIKLFPKDKRKDVSIFYFFLRQIDDLVDEKKEKNKFYQVKRDFFYSLKTNKKAKFNFNQGAIDLIKKYKIPTKYFFVFFNTQERELNKKSNINDLKDLDKYCFGVAGVVGLMMNKILDLNKDLDNEAIIFGNFMQKVNILRDIKEDKKKGKNYLPKKLLKKFGISEKNLVKDKYKYKSMIKYIGEESKKNLEKINFSKINLQIRIPLLLAKNTYLKILEKIIKNPFFYYHKRCQLSFFDWIVIFFKTIFYE